MKIVPFCESKESIEFYKRARQYLLAK